MTATATPTTDKPASATKPATFKDPGLANVIAADTSMSFIDGAKGVLEYVGIDIDSLARNSTFEESVFLLWNRRLPRKSELDAFVKSIQQEYDIPDAMHGIIARIPADAVPMQALRTLVSALALFDPETEDGSPEANQRKSIRLLAKTATLIAAFDRHRKGKSFVKPDKSLNVATNFLWMLRGEKPTEAMAKALDVCLILHADHGFNASTFAAMVTISTLSDMYSAVTTAIGTFNSLRRSLDETASQIATESGLSTDEAVDAVERTLELADVVLEGMAEVYESSATSP